MAELEKPQHIQTQSLPQPFQVQYQHQPEPVQSTPLGHTPVPEYFQEDARQDIPGIHTNQGNSANTSSYQQDMNIHQQVPIERLPEPDPTPTLRRSDRATRGQTSRYDDFVQTIHPVYPPPNIPSTCYQYQYPQMMTNQMMPNQMMINQLMSNQMMTNQMMTNNLLQPTMLWYQ